MKKRDHTMHNVIAATGVTDTITIFMLVPAILVAVGWFGSELLRVADVLRRLYHVYILNDSPKPPPEEGQRAAKILLQGMIALLIAGAFMCLTIVIDKVRWNFVRWASQEFGTANFAKASPIAGALYEDIPIIAINALMLTAFVIGIVVVRQWRHGLESIGKGAGHVPDA